VGPWITEPSSFSTLELKLTRLFGFGGFAVIDCACEGEFELILEARALQRMILFFFASAVRGGFNPSELEFDSKLHDHFSNQEAISTS
jgi:hypothetical protein